jgi:hypothetical protein
MGQSEFCVRSTFWIEVEEFQTELMNGVLSDGDFVWVLGISTFYADVVCLESGIACEAGKGGSRVNSRD